MWDARRNKVIAAQPAVTVGAYSALDAVGGMLTFPGAALSVGGSGFIYGISIIDVSQVAAALTLFLFDRPFTAVADNAPFTVNDADAIGAIAVIASGTYKGIGSAWSIYSATLPAPLAYRCFANRSLYGQLVATATPSYLTTADLLIKLHVGLVN